MSVYLNLDESLITVAPALDDVEPILVVKTRYRTYASEGADGVIRQMITRTGRASFKPLIPVEQEGSAAYETRITSKESNGLAEFETRTVYLAGGAGSVFYATDRQVRFSAKWYGENQRYLELRLKVHPGAEVVANRGMANLREQGEFNFLGQVRNGGWAEIHIDNLTHVGLSMSIHSVTDDFSQATKRPDEAIAPTNTRWSRILSDD